MPVREGKSKAQESRGKELIKEVDALIYALHKGRSGTSYVLDGKMRKRKVDGSVEGLGGSGSGYKMVCIA